MQEANLDHNFITTFCEFLLFRPGAPGEVMLTPTQWRNEKQMVVKYVQVSCTHMAKQQALADSRMLQVASPAPAQSTVASGHIMNLFIPESFHFIL